MKHVPYNVQKCVMVFTALLERASERDTLGRVFSCRFDQCYNEVNSGSHGAIILHSFAVECRLKDQD